MCRKEEKRKFKLCVVLFSSSMFEDASQLEGGRVWIRWSGRSSAFHYHGLIRTNSAARIEEKSQNK